VGGAAEHPRTGPDRHAVSNKALVRRYAEQFQGAGNRPPGRQVTIDLMDRVRIA
jgi:hypothetical protein